VIGGLLLMIFIGYDVDLLLKQSSARIGWHGETLEIAEYVVLPFLVFMAPMYVAVRWVIRKSLAPLASAATRIDSVQGVERGFRLELAGLPSEVLPFVRAINDLLDRRDDIAIRRESFAAEAAHELKTPLAILMLELDRLGGSEAARLKEDVRMMNRLLDQIVLMAQLDAHAVAPIAGEEVDLAEVAGQVVVRLAPIAAEQGKGLAIEVIDRGIIHGRSELLMAAVRNMVENALRVTPENEAVTVFVGPGTQIRVRDGGPGLDAEELARLSLPFARSGDADSGGVGLGLAIVFKIVSAYRGTLETDRERRELRICFPPHRGAEPLPDTES
jgi:two-component system OmpR family sensor kinase